MSRIGKKPVAIPSGVKVNVAEREISVEGKLGKLVWTHRPEVNVAVEGNEVIVSRDNDDRLPRALHGLTRAVYRKFSICRICLRKLADQGLIPGLKKASW